MKLPNGYGTVYKLGGNRRRPWVVKKFIEGKQKPLGYFVTYTAALAFLVDYNKCPELYGPEITFSQVYSAFRDEHWPRITDTARSGYKNSFKHSWRLYDKPFRQIKLSDLQAVIHDCQAGYATQKKIRTLFHMLYKYALKNDLADKDYSLYVVVSKDDKRREKQPFTIRQIRKLARTGGPTAELALMMMYTGLRPSEFLRLQSSHVNWRGRYLVVKQSKTLAGRNRMVPIHDSVLRFFLARRENKFLAGGDKPLTYSRLRSAFATLMDEMRMHHTPYECRHTCATMLDNAGANAIATKKILGHAMPDVTSKYYTHKRLHELQKAIALLPDCA